MLCYCGSQVKYKDCCEPFHTGIKIAPTALTLMRSRYSAFVIVNMNYLIKTTDPQTRQKFDLIQNKDWAENVEFEKLEIINEETDRNKARVEFKVYYKSKLNGQSQIHHEISKFRKQNNEWFFREGKSQTSNY